MITNKELKTIASDLYKERIFCDRFLRDPKTELMMVFMALALLDDQAREELQSKEPVFIYEYLDKSTGVAINGYPTFSSFRFLNQKEFDIMYKYYEAIKSSVDDALDNDEEEVNEKDNVE